MNGSLLFSARRYPVRESGYAARCMVEGSRHAISCSRRGGAVGARARSSVAREPSFWLPRCDVTNRRSNEAVLSQPSVRLRVKRVFMGRDRSAHGRTNVCGFDFIVARFTFARPVILLLSLT